MPMMPHLAEHFRWRSARERIYDFCHFPRGKVSSLPLYRELYFPSLFLSFHWKCVFVLLLPLSLLMWCWWWWWLLLLPLLLCPPHFTFYMHHVISFAFLPLFSCYIFFIIIFASGFAISICIEIDYLCPYGIIQFNIKLCRNVILAAAGVCARQPFNGNEMKWKHEHSEWGREKIET